MNTREQQLASIAQEISACQRCSLYKAAANPVPGEGNPFADLVFIGEAPGYYEDQQGRPFVGQAGRLLEQSLASIGLSRKEVFIAGKRGVNNEKQRTTKRSRTTNRTDGADIDILKVKAQMLKLHLKFYQTPGFKLLF
ncbi:hypothetical protein B5M47_02300 [candidate division CPR3 bacterium 4484_211]|uniref:Uracil-DNA glycosylase-like domain-containing protein n=1 Tax=candidate division CPR3 bacterium 4484_211 TaxID=1968527 RepID=A0A1W9NYD8_UNCC3|nr:MAG: hypothetical protein B5M47_02300 [candidate division CPR3 bacterium 4484_211]